MSVEESWPNSSASDQKGSHPPNIDPKSGFDPTSGIFHSLHQLTDPLKVPTSPNLDTASYVLSQLPGLDEAESRTALVDSVTGRQVTFAELRRSIESLAASLHLALEVNKGDVVFVLAPNSVMYPTICLAVFLVGAILTTANPLNTGPEIAKQVRDSGAKLVITVPEEAHKVASTGVPTIFTNRTGDESSVSVEELIECSYPAGHSPCDWPRPARTDTAAILYSSGTTGTSKGVVLTHDNFISIITLLKWSVNATSSQDDVFLCFIPMFHIYGLAFFGLGLFCSGVTTVVMPKYELGAMLDAIKAYQVNNIPAVPPVILGLVKHTDRLNSDLSSLRRVGSGAAPLSKEVTDGFREKFPWVELRQGYGLTESCGAATFFVSDRLAKARSGSCGALIPSFQAKVVDVETGSALPPNRKGELWLRSPAIMRGYLRNEEATAATITSDGWLRTGDLCYIDGDGFVYIVDRIKELIKHNGYQVAPAELEAVLLSHPDILDAAVIPVEDEDAGQIPMAYVVGATGSNLTEEQVIRFVASQVAPYKKVRRVRFVTMIPKSAAGKILRKELVLQSRQQLSSKL